MSNQKRRKYILSFLTAAMIGEASTFSTNSLPMQSPLCQKHFTRRPHIKCLWRRPECPEILQFIPAFKRDISLSSAVRILGCTWLIGKTAQKKEYTPQTQVLSNLYAAIYSSLQAQSFITEIIPSFSTNCNKISSIFSTILSTICQKCISLSV